MIKDFLVTDGNFLVTGAASGIGKEVVKMLIKSSNKVLAVDRDTAKLDILFNEIKSDNLTILLGDIISSETRDKIHHYPHKFNGIVNSAGIINLVPFKFIKEDSLTDMVRNNYEAPVLLNSLLLKKNKIIEGGSIIFLSSVMSQISTQTNGLYTGTKAALTGITKTMALELAPLKIRVNSVSPGFVRTPMLDFIERQTDIKQAEKNHPLGFGESADVANCIIFLLSDASRWITGSNIIIDGGYCAK